MAFVAAAALFLHQPVQEEVTPSRSSNQDNSYATAQQQMHNVWLESASHPSEMCSCTRVSVDEDISESRRIHLPESQQMHNVWLESASHPSETCLCTGCCLWTKTSQSHDGSIFPNRSKCTTCGLNLLHTPLRRVCAQAVACGRRHLRVTTDPSSRIAANAQRVA